MSAQQGSDGGRLLQPELRCLGDEALAATREKEGSGLVPSDLRMLTYPLAPGNEGTATGGLLTLCTQESTDSSPEHIC